MPRRATDNEHDSWTQGTLFLELCRLEEHWIDFISYENNQRRC